MKKPRVAATKARPFEAASGDVEAIVAGVHGNPFAVLGIHEAVNGFITRCFVPNAEAATAFTLDGKEVGTLVRRHDAGFFEGKVDIDERQPLRYRLNNAGGEWWLTDPYSFGPVLGPMDDYYIAEGSHLRLFDTENILYAANSVKELRRSPILVYSEIYRSSDRGLNWQRIHREGMGWYTDLLCILRIPMWFSPGPRLDCGGEAQSVFGEVSFLMTAWMWCSIRTTLLLSTLASAIGGFSRVSYLAQIGQPNKF